MFGVVIFLAAFLLFQVQLIVAKHLLPWFGGTPAVWTTSQMFFQVLLLGGYSYAHVLTRMAGIRTQTYIHLALLLASVASVLGLAVWAGTPLLAPGSLKPAGDENPGPLLLLTLAVTVGLPFFVVATTGPLLQRWHARRSTSLSRTYRLYALSNVGSFLGLLSYPFGIEWLLDLPQQAWMWTLLFGVFAAGCAAVAWSSAQHPGVTAQGDGAPGRVIPIGHGPDESAPSNSGPARVTLWLLLTFTTSVMFLATTNQLTQDVAAVPFLWVLPLAIYLLTFILCFDHPDWYSRRWMFVAAAASGIAALPTVAAGFDVPYQIGAHSFFLLSFCMLCHGELVRLRPGVGHLTLFYLVVASGGALGGIFVSLLAPGVFSDFWEFHLAIVVGWMVLAWAWAIDRGSPFHTGDRWIFAAVLVIVLGLAIRFPIERMRFADQNWLRSNDWTITLVGATALTTVICATFWKSWVARSAVWPQLAVVIFVGLMGLSLMQSIGMSRQGVLHAARNFYGVIKVLTVDVAGGQLRELKHGTTTHGVQLDDLAHRSTPTAYYGRSSGISLAATRFVRAGSVSAGSQEGVHFGIVGMGIGTMSAFAKAGDRVRYYEINPEVIHVATGQVPFFTFVKDSRAHASVVAGDARLSLERELSAGQPQQFDLLVMDAFSSDSVPVHLVTEEAFRLYSAHLKAEDSILAVNVTNRYIDLEPVVAANARELGFHGIRVDSAGALPVVAQSSWILLARNPQVFYDPVTRSSPGRRLRERFVRFTDKYSNLYRVLR
jgi:hypothetical protein